MLHHFRVTTPISKVACSVLFALSGIVQAASDNTDTSASETMVVTASTINQIGQQIDRKQMEQLQTENVADLFRNQTSVSVGGGSRQAQRIYVRGIEASNLNITIDGAKQGRNLFQHRGNISSIDPDILRVVNISTLPASDQGSGALGGLISFETVDAQDLLHGDEEYGGKIKTGIGSINSSKNGAITLYGLHGEHLGVLAHLKGNNFDDYNTGDGTKIHGSAGKDREYFLKLSGLDIKNNDVTFTIEQNRNSGLYRFGKGDTAYNANATLNYQVLKRNTYTLNHRYTPEDHPLINLKDSFFYNKTSLDNQTSAMQIESEAAGTDLTNTFLFSLGETEHHLTVGVDYYDETARSAKAGSAVGNDNNSVNLGLYVQERLTWGKANLALGSRFDNYSTDFGSVAFNGHELSPSLSAEYKLTSSLTAFAGYGEAIRSTGVIPVQWLSLVSGTPTFNTQSGKNSNHQPFKPEDSTRTEYGIEYQHDSLWQLVDLMTIKITAFHTDIDNLIQPIGGMMETPVTGFYNDDPITSKGYEAQVRMSLTNIDSSLSFTHTDTEDQNGHAIIVTRRVGASSGDRYVWNTQWTTGDDQIHLGYTLKYVESLHTETIHQAGYTLHSINSSWHPERVDGVTLSLSVINLFNKNYAEQTTIGENGTAVYEPGRDIRFTAAYVF